MAQMKSDSMTFKTQKTVGQLADILRDAAQRLNVDEMFRIGEDDPLAGIGNQTDQPDIAIAMSGRLGMLGGLKHFRMGSANNIWGVQIFVYDLGNERAVELIALGESVFADFGSLGNGSGVLNMGSSKEKRDTLAQMML